MEGHVGWMAKVIPSGEGGEADDGIVMVGLEYSWQANGFHVHHGWTCGPRA